MKTLKAWIEAMRLRTLPVSVAGVLTAVGFNIADGTFKAAPAALCLLFAVLCQIASNFANEYYDYRAGRDRVGREGPRRGVTEGDLSAASMKRAVFATLALAAVVGLSLVYWGGVWLIAAGALIGIGALAYSAGPWPLSTHCLGEAAVFVFFGIVPVNLTYYVQALAWSHDVFLGSCAVGLMGANVLIVNNYRDIPDDRAVGKHTLATAFGRKTVLVLYILFATLASVLMFGRWYDIGPLWIAVPVGYVALSARVVTFMARKSGHELNPCLGITAMLMFAVSLCFVIGEAICAG